MVRQEKDNEANTGQLLKVADIALDCIVDRYRKDTETRPGAVDQCKTFIDEEFLVVHN